MKIHATRRHANIALYAVTLAVALLGGCNAALDARSEHAGWLDTVLGTLTGGPLGHGAGRN